MDIKQELKNQGLNEKQSTVYLAALELGRSTIISLSHRTGIKRMTVYDIVLQLIQRGYLSEAKMGKRRLFIAENPTNLLTTSEQRFFELKKLIPQLSNIYQKSISKPEIRFFDGINGLRNIMEELLAMNEKEQLYWSSIEELIEIFGIVYMDNWVKRRIKKGIMSKVLLVKRRKKIEPEFSSSGELLREIHWLPSVFNSNGIICIFDNKMAFISSKKELFGFIVTSEELVSMMRLIFRSMWQTTK